ncbi:hypothetical protein M0812_19428 [Anaeramoeba flamelloides]|uniref:Uncharacterized protein n=1 Tax=Anaeramoeba flamelloides TaxID=1746091 RepID=A0AAV7Z431_9EUKA|nr:hypothetical protein M0812_19428 [Anaeramoeba flamelloides]
MSNSTKHLKIEKNKVTRKKPNYTFSPPTKPKKQKNKRNQTTTKTKTKTKKLNAKKKMGMKEKESWFEFGSNHEQTTTKEFQPQPSSSMDLDELELRFKETESQSQPSTIVEEHEVGFQNEFGNCDTGSEASTNTDTETESDGENENQNNRSNKSNSKNEGEDLDSVFDKADSKPTKKDFNTDFVKWNKDSKFKFNVVSNKKSIKEKRRNRFRRSYSRVNRKSNTEHLGWKKKNGLRRVKSDEADDLFVSEFDGFVIMRSSKISKRSPPRVSLTIEEIEKIEQRNLEKQKLEEIENNFRPETEPSKQKKSRPTLFKRIKIKKKKLIKNKK